MTQGLPSVLPDWLLREATSVALARNERLFHVGERVEHIHCVRQGELLAVRYLGDGSEAVMQRARDGEFFAQSAMLVPHYSCDARAASPTEVLRIPVRELREGLGSDGAFALAFAGQLAADLRRQCTRVERLRIKRARDRVRHYLVCEGAFARRRRQAAGLGPRTGAGTRNPVPHARRAGVQRRGPSRGRRRGPGAGVPGPGQLFGLARAFRPISMM
jgi:CRP-like cAMP-binding protein